MSYRDLNLLSVSTKDIIVSGQHESSLDVEYLSVVSISITSRRGPKVLRSSSILYCTLSIIHMGK